MILSSRHQSNTNPAATEQFGKTKMKAVEFLQTKVAKGSVWTKSGNRYYINDAAPIVRINRGQKVYIDLDTFEVKCYTDSNGQSAKWAMNESQRVINALAPLARLARIINNSTNC
jgi:hypothetical protein